MINPDIYGYKYYDTSAIGITNRLKVLKTKTVAKSLIDNVNEAFPKGITNKVHRGILAIARKTLLNKLDIDIDKTEFTQVDPSTLKYRSKEFRDPNTTYIAKIDQGINHLIIIINNGRILNADTSKLIGLVNHNTWKNIFSRCTELYKVTNPVSYNDSREARRILKANS